MKRTIQWSMLFLCVLSIFGCSTFRGSMLSPQLSPKEDKIAEELEKKYLTYDENSETSKYERDLDAKKINGKEISEKEFQDVMKQKRNQILNNLILLMNIRYAQYERCFYQTDATISTAFDAAVLGVTAAGTVVGGSATKSILSAIAAGITGSRLSIEKNFLFEKTSPVLMAKMRSMREEKFKTIDTNMKKNIKEYPLERGLVDIQEYFYSGTIAGALQAISNEIGKPTDEDIIKKFTERKRAFDKMFGVSEKEETKKVVALLKRVYYSYGKDSQERKDFDTTANEINTNYQDFLSFVNIPPNLDQVNEYRYRLEDKSGTITTKLKEEEEKS